MKSIKAVVNRVVNPIAKKRGIIHGKIILEWEKIVGTQYATYCAPLKVTFNQGRRTHGILHIKVNPSHALLLSHSQDLVIEKINTFFGYKAVHSLKIIQIPFEPKPNSTTLKVAAPFKKDTENEEKPSAQDRLSHALEELERLIQDDMRKKSS